jgi:hypothetical protein
MKLDILKLYVIYVANLPYKILKTLGMKFESHQLRLVLRCFLSQTERPLKATEKNCGQTE